MHCKGPENYQDNINQLTLHENQVLTIYIAKHLYTFGQKSSSK